MSLSQCLRNYFLLYKFFLTKITKQIKKPTKNLPPDIQQTASVVQWLAFWPLAPKFAGSNPAEAVGFFRRKNPQQAFLRRGSKRICPMSQLCGMSKNLVIYVNYGLLAKFQVQFLPSLAEVSHAAWCVQRLWR